MNHSNTEGKTLQLQFASSLDADGHIGINSDKHNYQMRQATFATVKTQMNVGAFF